MALVGNRVLFSHMPRTAGRAAGRMLSRAGLGRPVHPVVNHEPLCELLEMYGTRPRMVGTIRPPAQWYIAMAVSSVQSHSLWFKPYLRAARVRTYHVDDSWERWREDCNWARLIQVMADPSVWLGAVPNEPDSHILQRLSGMSLYASNYCRAFLLREAWTLPGDELRRHHRELVGLTHMVLMHRLVEGLTTVVAGFTEAKLERVHIRERTRRVSFQMAYGSKAGSNLLKMINEGDGVLYRHWQSSACTEVQR